MDFDDDDFDDDICDEDLLTAASLPPPPKTSLPARPTTASAGLAKPHVPLANSFNQGRHGSHAAISGSVGAAALPAIIDLDDFPNGAFSGSPAPHHSGASHPYTGFSRQPPVGAPAPAYRQTTLFGTSHTAVERPGPSQPNNANKNRVFRADLPPEPPTHHDTDPAAMRTWVYPTNLGPTRDYQYTIVKKGLFNNTLVALPTGLGKTFIAATVMLNFFRWTKSAKIVFLAPTKPLVSQQVDACFNIAGIPRSKTTLLTGEVSPALRAEEWQERRVFFMTPQTLENDLSHGTADPKSIALLVIDEAHRATGNYSYVRVVEFLRRFSKSFRVLALTATPGSKVEAVQEVVDNLGISQVEIRTEDSMDIRQYVHKRDEDIVLLDPSEEMLLVQDLFSKALKPLLDKLSSQGIRYGRDAMSLTVYGLMKAKQDWMGHAGRQANQGVKFMMAAVFTVLQSLAHSIKLLNFHGMKPFYDNMVEFRSDTESKGNKGSKTKRQILDHPGFQEMMNKLGAWASKDDFVSHPKLTHLSDTVLNHFMDAGDGREGTQSSNTRIIVFSEYRASAEEIVRVLNIHKPLIRAAVFVGQADSKNSGGMKQAEQIERIQKFKNGEFNVLVATSIGEEGLDIGQVDLIICYDSSSSPIRMLQRMGRTGRKRAGRVVLLLMRGKEENKFLESKDGYEKMQALICDGDRFNFRYDLSTRIVPREIVPEVDLRHVEIPLENTQTQGLPEPKRGAARKKKPPKKFNMPDGVETGFQSVAALVSRQTTAKPKNPIKAPIPKKSAEEQDTVQIPDLGRVLLKSAQNEELNKVYKNLPYFHQEKMEDIEQIDLTAHPTAQRTLRRTVGLQHGEHTKRAVRLFRKLARSQSSTDRFVKPYGDTDQSRYHELPTPGVVSEDDEIASREPPKKKRKVASRDDEMNEVVELPSLPKALPAKPRKAPVAKKAAANAQSRAVAGRKRQAPSEEDAPAPGRKRTAGSNVHVMQITPAKPRGRPKKAQARSGIYDESADEGDDCRRTSDLDLTDDSDNGSDLEGFLVGDDVGTSSAVMTSSMRQRSTSPTPPLVAASAKPRQQKRTLVMSQSSVTQDSEDDMPTMSQMMRDKRSGNSSGLSQATVTNDLSSEDDGETDVTVGRRVDRGRTGQRHVVSDDEDEDEEDEGDDYFSD